MPAVEGLEVDPESGRYEPRSGYGVISILNRVSPIILNGNSPERVGWEMFQACARNPSEKVSRGSSLSLFLGSPRRACCAAVYT
jgi:hypothetical protein